MECHSSSTWRKVIAHPVTCSFSSNLFVSSLCTCSCHSGVEIKMNEAGALFFILSARAVIKTGAARIVVACRWCDWYGVKARGKVSQRQINGWLSKMKEMEDENQALLLQGTLAEQHRAAICLCSDLSGKMWSMLVISSRPHFSIFVLLLYTPFGLFLTEPYISVRWYTLCGQRRDMTPGRMIERHLSERDIKSNKELPASLWSELGVWSGKEKAISTARQEQISLHCKEESKNQNGKTFIYI